MLQKNEIEDNLKGCNVEEIVVNGDKKIQGIKLKIDEQMQEDIMKQSLSYKKSDRDIFLLKSKLSMLRISM